MLPEMLSGKCFPMFREYFYRRAEGAAGGKIWVGTIKIMEIMENDAKFAKTGLPSWRNSIAKNYLR